LGLIPLPHDLINIVSFRQFKVNKCTFNFELQSLVTTCLKDRRTRIKVTLLPGQESVTNVRIRQSYGYVVASE